MILALSDGEGSRTFSFRVQFTHHDVGGVTDDGARDPGNVPTQEAHARLLQFVVTLLGPAERLVDVAHRLFERGELAHGVGDLPAPEGRDALVQPGHALLAHHLAPPLAQVLGVRGEGGLHADLDRLEGAQEDVGDELGRRGGAQVDERPVRVGEEVVAVLVLEDLVEAVLAQALEGVADERGGPAEEDPAEALGREDAAPGLEVGRVQLAVDLSSGLDQVERGHERVGWAARYDPSQHAGCEVFRLCLGEMSESVDVEGTWKNAGKGWELAGGRARATQVHTEFGSILPNGYDLSVSADGGFNADAIFSVSSRRDTQSMVVTAKHAHTQKSQIPTQVIGDGKSMVCFELGTIREGEQINR